MQHNTSYTMVPRSQSQAQPFLALSDAISDEQKLVLLDYWRSVAKRKWAILALALVVAVVAAAVAYAMTPMYRSTVTLLIEQDKQKLVTVEEVYSGVSNGREHYQTEVELLKSREVLLRAVTDMKLWDNPEYDPRRKDESFTARLRTTLGFAETRKTWSDETLAEGVLGKFREAVEVEPVRLSQLVKISFASSDPMLAATVANGIAEAYIANNRDARFKMTQEATTWLQDRLEGLRQKVVDSEHALQEYRDKNGLVKMGGSAEAIDSAQIINLSQKLMDAKLKRAESESIYTQLQLAKSSHDYSTVDAVSRHPQVLDAKNRETAAQLNVSQLAQRYGFEHPKMVQANAELEAAKLNTQQQMAAVASSLERDFEQTRATEKSLQQSLNAQRGAVATVNRAESQLATLERDVQGNRQLYEMFMARSKETNVTDGVQTAVARIVDAAVPAAQPFKPKKGQLIAIAFALGLGLGAATSLLLDRLDNTLKGGEDAENKLKLPLIAATPVLETHERPATMKMFLEHGESMFSESIRTARTSVLLSNIDEPRKIILVTSALPGEGKSSIAANLALAHAHTKPTLLIDADMRRPQVARSFDLAPGAKGLSNLVSGEAERVDCIHAVAHSGLRVMPCGDIPPNPTELLLSQRFKETLRQQ
jgi:succinoglycan biosynthesis transport protein ExoP